MQLLRRHFRAFRVWGLMGYIGVILGLYLENGKENGIYYLGFRVILGLYWDDGKENGIYYLGFRVMLG